MKIFFNSLFALAVLVSSFVLTSCEEELEGNLELSVSSTIIIADGDDEVVVTVKIGDVDVTDRATLYVNNDRLSSNVFSTEKPGSYKFYASYNGQISNKVTVNAANPALYVALPEDSQADKFSDFQRKVLLTEATGTWCGYCPYMITALEWFSENGSNADNAVIVATHSGDEFSNAASEAVLAAMKASSYPSCFLDLDPSALIMNDAPAVNVENINSMIGMQMKNTARVGISAATAVSVDSTIVGVRAAVKVSKDGNYRINAWLIEDGVEAYQASNWYEFSDGQAQVLIAHKHVLRAASCVSPIQGELLGDKGACKAGDVVEYYYEFDAAKAGVVDMKNCKVAVMVTTGSSSKYYVNNIIECNAGESVPFAYN